MPTVVHSTTDGKTQRLILRCSCRGFRTTAISDSKIDGDTLHLITAITDLDPTKSRRNDSPQFREGRLRVPQRRFML